MLKKIVEWNVPFQKHRHILTAFCMSEFQIVCAGTLIHSARGPSLDVRI